MGSRLSDFQGLPYALGHRVSSAFKGRLAVGPWFGVGGFAFTNARRGNQ